VAVHPPPLENKWSNIFAVGGSERTYSITGARDAFWAAFDRYAQLCHVDWVKIIVEDG